MNTYLRKANEYDIDFLFNLVNEPLCRSNSLSTKEIKYTEHKKWYENILKSNSSDIYIYMNDFEESIGQGRLDFDGNDAYISYSIISQYRGQGHGKLIISLLEDKVLIKKNIERLHAKVKYSNMVSRRIFESYGYKLNEKKYYTEYIKDINCNVKRCK